MKRFHWIDYVCEPILLRAGFGTYRSIFVDYKKKRGNELYEVSVGNRYTDT